MWSSSATRGNGSISRASRPGWRVRFTSSESWFLHDPPQLLLKRARREIRRSGMLGFLDVLAFKAYYALRLARADARWIDIEVRRLRQRYPADLDAIPRLDAPSPNTEEVRSFLEALRPGLMIARCKVMLHPKIFDLPTAGTFVLHPGICPEYRNSHGCFCCSLPT